jgi:hypothetical protein
MPHLVTSASASVLMLMGCLLGVVFMVRFLVAVTRDGKMHTGHAVRPGGLHYAADASRARTRRRAVLANSSSHLAIGVVRITTALTGNSGSGSREAAAGGLHAAAAGKAGREAGATSERRYRSG